MAEKKGRTPAFPEIVDLMLKNLGETEQILYEKAIKDGYKNEKCGECTSVFLAHKSLIRCEHPSCPMLARDEKGNTGPSLLDMIFHKVPK